MRGSGRERQLRGTNTVRPSWWFKKKKKKADLRERCRRVDCVCPNGILDLYHLLHVPKEVPIANIDGSIDRDASPPIPLLPISRLSQSVQTTVTIIQLQRKKMLMFVCGKVLYPK